MAEYVNVWNVVFIGVSYFFLFIGINTSENLISTIYVANYGNLGYFWLATLYISFAISSLFSTPMINLWGHIRWMQVGTFWYMVWLVAGLLPVALSDSKTNHTTIWIVMILAGIINGFGASLLWIGWNTYISSCTTPLNVGLYFGILWSLFMFSQIIGNFVAAILINKLKNI